jgi:hypothetical protein
MNHEDLVRNSLIAVSGAIPYVGGSLSFLLDKYIPSEAEKRRNEFLNKLADDLEELKDKVEDFNFSSPEFLNIFTRMLRASIDEYRDEKITAFRNLVINIVISPQKFNELDYYSRLVIKMIPDEIKILRVFYLLDVKNELKSFDINRDKRDIYEIISKVYGTQDYLYIQALLIECQRYRLILGNEVAQKKYGDGREGLYLTEIGKNFLQYIFEPKEGDV